VEVNSNFFDGAASTETPTRWSDGQSQRIRLPRCCALHTHMHDAVCRLPRIHLPRLSEKGSEGSFESGFGRYERPKWVQKCFHGGLWGYARGASKAFRTVSTRSTLAIHAA
jgi:hypothetical protein